MGDMNAQLYSNVKASCNNRSKLLSDFNEMHDFVSICLLNSCIGATSTFVSYNKKHESLIDHILVPDCIVDRIQHSEI